MGGEVRYYSVEETARGLRLTPERVLEILEAGELEGIPAAGASEASWRIPIHDDMSVPPPPTVTAISAEPPTGEPRDLPKGPGKRRLPPSEVSETAETSRHTVEPTRGDDAASNRQPISESGWVSTQQAARALGISARTVRWHIERGNLDAKSEGEGVERTWRVSVDSLQAFRDSRQAAAASPRGNRVYDIDAEIAAESPSSAIRELVEEARRAEAARVRLKFSEQAQSTLEAELAEERRRREIAKREREEAQRERDELRRRLEAPSAPRAT